MNNDKIQLINQAINAAENQLKQARQLLSEMEGGKGVSANPLQNTTPAEVPGIVGIFDGESMLTANNERHPVPANYASKSMLVVGDTLKLMEENGEKRFKQIEHVKRHKTMGILTKKDGKFRLVTPEGSYKVLPVSIEHYKGEVGDEISAYLPAGNLTVAYAALESVVKKQSPKPVESVEPVTPVTPVAPVPPKPVVKEPVPVKKPPEIKSVPAKKVQSAPVPRPLPVHKPAETKLPPAPAPATQAPPVTSNEPVKMPEVEDDELR